MRRLLFVAILASWVVMATLLVQRQAPPPDSPGMPLPETALDGRDEWFGVYRQGAKIGHAHRVTARLPDGYVFHEESIVALAMLGIPQTLRTTLRAETDEAFALRRVAFTLISPATSFTATGAAEANVLHLRYGPQGQQATLDVPLAEPIYLPSTLRPRVLAGDLTPGTRYTVAAFSPVTLRNEPFSVVVEGREVLADHGGIETTRLAEEHQGVRTHAWLDASGAVVREEAPLGFTLEREPRAQAVAGALARAPVDLVTASRIPLSGRIDDPRGAEMLTLRVTGSGAAHVPDDPPRQRHVADVLRITRERVPAPPAALGREAAPAAGVHDAAGGDLTPYTVAAPLIESDDPAVVAAARQIVGDSGDAATAARRLVAWVHTTLVKAPSVTVPSAREVLASRRGDCNEHAVLLAALARAAGIPARVVAGAVYAEDGFYYHAWTELWLGAWVSADAVFGQLPVDATHVKLVEGGPERHMALASVIGQLAFAVEEVR